MASKLDILEKNVGKRYKLLCYMQDTIPAWQRDGAPLYKKVIKRYHLAFDYYSCENGDYAP